MKKFIPSFMCVAVLGFQLASAASLEVDKSRSRIQVDAKATGHRFTGDLKNYEVEVEGDAASLAPESFELNWKFKDLDTDDEKRDSEMLKWLGSDDEKGSFKLDKSWTDENGVQHGMGTLTIHGVSKSISFPFAAKKDGDWVTIDGKVSMDYRNFDLPVIRAMAVMTVDPQLVVRFHVVGKIN
jgi:polyisoprenoid-binding protein YceI